MRKDQLLVCYGKDGKTMARQLLEAAYIKSMLDVNMKVALKPNLVVAKPCSSGATTSPEIVAGVIEYLKDNGIKHITIMEGSWAGDSTERAWEVCGYRELSKKYNVPLVDLKTDRTQRVNTDRMEFEVCLSALKSDFMINLPVLKGHCQTRMTCALKNVKGCIPDGEKRRFHNIGLHAPIAMLNTVIKPKLILVDALCGDLTFEEGGTPVEMDRMIIGFDPVKVDAYGASLIGVDKKEIKHLVIAERLGVGSSEIDDDTVIELNHYEGLAKPTQLTRKVRQMMLHVKEKQACSICYASLVHALFRLNENGELRNFKEDIHIGQGYKGTKTQGMGVGQCTWGFSNSLPGCPPKAQDILDWLRKNLNDRDL